MVSWVSAFASELFWPLVTSIATQTSHLGRRLADAVLGVDAAWTLSHASGVALIARRHSRWQCLRLAASYADFVGGTRSKSPTGAPIPVPQVLTACEGLLDGLLPGVVARRHADRKLTDLRAAVGR